MKLRSLFFILFVFFVIIGQAQNARTIRGRILDSFSKEPLPGATVYINQTSLGTVTNGNGEFTLRFASNESEQLELVASFIGYKQQVIPIGRKFIFEILLEEDVKALDEVVVTSSYGTRKLKQEVVASITSIKTKDIVTEQTAISFDELLQGQSAGVYIDGSSEIGKPVDIHIRGQGSLTPLTANSVGTSTQPLIIVDGVILAEELDLDGNNFFDAGGGLYSEDPSNPFAKIGITDIESINILKDAAAVSLYGADGANGVILITTKRGEKGPMKFTFSAQTGFSNPTNQITYMNGEQYQELRNLFYKNNGDEGNVQQWNGVDTDWYDLMNQTGNYQKYNFSLSGGKEKFTYRVSLEHQNIKEPQINNEFQKYGSALALDYQAKKWKLSLTTKPSLTVKNAPNTLHGYAVPPTIAPYQEDGSYTSFDTYGNPLAVANQNRGLVKNKSLINSLSFNYRFNESLSFSSLYGLDFSNKDQDTYFSGLNETGITAKGEKGIRMLRDRDVRNWNWNARLFYTKTFKEIHYFDFTAGVEATQKSTKYNYARGVNFPEPDAIMPIETADYQTYESDKNESTGRSFLSQANYDFNKKYFLLANFRIDQSSAFGGDNNTSYNGGLGASWIISKEDFLAQNEWLTFLRARISYGTSGNSRIGSYRALGLYNFYDKTANGYNYGYYATPSTAPNPNLGWEKNIKFNVGFDFSIRENFTATIELFHDDIRDMIVSRDVIPEIGYGSVQINGAEMYNQGIEFSTQYQVFSNEKFKWKLNFNISKIKNEVTHLQGLGSEYSSAERARAQRIGYSTSVIWGYNFVGIDPATGRELYQIEGNTVDANYLKQHYKETTNWVPIGNSQPDVYGGLNNRFTIGKNISVSVNANYSIGGDELISSEYVDKYTNIFNRNMSVNAIEGSWKEPGDIAYYPSVGKTNPLVNNSTKLLYSNSHVKLQTINVSYAMPAQKWGLPFTTLSVFANGSNLYYWYMDKSPDGLNGIKELKNVYPEMRTFSFGVKAGF
ncbi:SusC/RagA family TonB-linked outer membrane protein [uncultured Draconibacterium sp.]|uniref:SusC/RagA family TonB-linked outer membrane protein n=1 Tax=uncultured Draconibacterium sp. TaxID=1573823 RepID=UPI00325FE194